MAKWLLVWLVRFIFDFAFRKLARHDFGWSQTSAALPDQLCVLGLVEIGGNSTDQYIKLNQLPKNI